MRIRFDQIDGLVRIYDGITYLTLFGSEKYQAIYNRIRYLISIKSGITYIFSHYFDSYDYLSIEKILTLHNVVIYIKSVINKDKNHFFDKKFLENGLIKYLKNNHKFLPIV